MSNSNKNNSNWGLFAIIFAAIFGLFKIGKHIYDRNESSGKLREAIRNMLKDGFTDEQILQGCYDSASKQFGRELVADEKDRIRNVFLKERATINVAEIKLNEKISEPNFSALPIEFDNSTKKILLDIHKLLEQVQPFLKFDPLFQKAKEFDRTKDVVDLQVFIKNQEYDIKKIWDVFGDLGRKIGSIIYMINASEPESIQKKREEFSRLSNFADTFKSLLVSRGKIIRHIGIMYNGKNKREETKKREQEELKVLVGLFQNDINCVAKEIGIFNEVVSNLSKI